MTRKSKTDNLLAFLNPRNLTRLAWSRGRRGFSDLWQSPGPNALFFIYTSLLWTVPLSLTENYKSLYLSRLGLGNLALGGVYAMDAGIRVGGVLLGALLAARFGYKRMLIAGDILSWTVPTLALAFATEPWHAYLAASFYATNSLVMASVQQMLVEDTPATRRSNAFGLMNLLNMLPFALLPFVASWAVQRWGVVPAMRAMLLYQSASMALGMIWRTRSMREAEATRRDLNLAGLLKLFRDAVVYLSRQKGIGPVMGLFVLTGFAGSVWRVYFGVFVVDHQGQAPEVLGWIGQATALFMAIGSLYLVPQAALKHPGRSLLWATALTVTAPLALALMKGPWGLAMVALGGGIATALHGALLNARIHNLLPEKSEGLAFSLCTSVMLLASIVGFSLVGALFESHFWLFPWLVAALGMAGSAVIWLDRNR